MEIETVDTVAQPILFVSRTSSMSPVDISRTMGAAFDALGAFIGRTGIAPVGPPVAIYRSFDGGTLAFDVGVPVAAADRVKAAGEVTAGETPALRAWKTVHKGPYARLRETYGALEAAMGRAGLPRPEIAWEVYLNDPDSTPEDDLLTEVYMPVP
jgi:effector-binding domain-containing protein